MPHLRAAEAWLKQASGDADLDRTYTQGTTVILNTKCGLLDNLNFAALEAEPFESFTFPPASFAIYRAVNNGTAQIRLQHWPSR